MRADEPMAAVEFLARSATRVRILSTLAAAGRLEKGELHDRVDASRTTVGRNLSALEERGWITGSNRTYEITTPGAWVAADFGALVETVRDADRFERVFDCVDPDEFGFDLREHAFTVTTAEPSDPLKMVNRHVANVRGADEMRAVLPLTGADAVRTAHDRVADAGVPMELVVTAPVADTFLANPEYEEPVAGLRAHEAVELRVHDGEVPYYFGLYADSVEFGLDDADGQPTVLLETAADEVYEWAADEFAAYFDAATPLGDWERPRDR
jgi:predicted transcriptional regulator